MLHLGRTHGARIQELWITSFLDPRIYTDFPAPALHQLAIQSNPISDRPYLIELFQGEAPLLRSLALQSSSWLPANLFTNLTRLYLSSFIQRPGLPRANWTLYNLSSFLAKCPALEDVFIHPRHPMGLRDATLPIIRLRHLKTIILAGVSLNLVLWFLHHVTIPTGDVTVRILWLCRSGIETTLLPVLPHLPELVGLRKLHIQLAPAKDNSMKALVRVALSTANTSLELRIDDMIEHVEESQDPGWTSALLASLANRMALSNITEMQVIDGGWIQKFFDFPALFALLPALSVLVYSKGNKDQFVRLLKHLLPLSSGPDPAPCPCTHLATLHVCVGEIPTMIDDMVSFACDRRACGRPLRKCIVEVASGMTESCDASKLESYVDLVEIQSC
ncbi:hypothetical protein SCP_1800210 [Sparassis crispa]|uniref:F-box domain-containing protein n=1 Tax=Sparassis crispa TaxID=139825 RepID=A0A401H6I7_9APHY|nr:hypothetical protein SCP_1800210 [Sparassis crispa]GBE89999.1 hypothetical protein SCP_1800210 [Sparassis crispa]